MMEKVISISSSMNKKIIEFLENYDDDEIKFVFLKNDSPLKSLFQVQTTETDEEKLMQKIKGLIKATTFGSMLYFSVKIE